jgi:glutaredoxin
MKTIAPVFLFFSLVFFACAAKRTDTNLQNKDNAEKKLGSDAQTQLHSHQANRPRGVESEPQIVMYMASWCGYCVRTRQLLNQLGASFVEKDIERSFQARVEHREILNQLGHSRGGVPVLRIGTEYVLGYNPRLVYYLVSQLQKQKQKQKQSAPAPLR